MAPHHSQIMDDPFEAVADPYEVRAQRIIACFSNMTATASGTPSAPMATSQATPTPPAQVWPHNPEEEWVNHIAHAYNTPSNQ